MPSAHSRVMPKKCVTCHMHEEGDGPGTKGGHTFQVGDEICLKCHAGPKAETLKWRLKVYRFRIQLMLKVLKVLLDSAPDRRSEQYKTAKRNYDIVISDGGVGLHNPRYAQALLAYSIWILQDIGVKNRK